jgi:dTDP-4-dehydrorhamnose reductase
MLGDAFYKQFSTNYILKCTDIDVNEDWLSYLDFRDFSEYRKDVLLFQPNYLFHLGAYTDLEYCELHPEDTYMTNTTSVENAVYITNELDIPILYISTAGIFDGKKDVYDDWDTPNPLGHYARSKYAGEVFVQQHAKRYLICRAGWMMGAGPRKDKKFIQKIMKQLKDKKEELYIVNDKFGTPTYTFDFARNVDALLQKEHWGLYNMVSEGVTSRLEVTRELLTCLGQENKIMITEVTSNYFKHEYFATRPHSERLLNKKLTLRGLNLMRDWKISLKEYLENYYHNYL